jgi:heterodisulfide reductase subunit B2
MSSSFAYYPGCSLHGASKEFDLSVKAVFSRLGIGLEEMEDWICCGATPAHAVNPTLALALSAWNLSKAGGRDVAVPCAACFNRMKTAVKHLGDDEELRMKINEIAGVEFKPGIQVKHVLTILKEFGAENIKQKVTRSLEGLKIACYYGCLLLRPPKIMQFDDPEAPTIMENLIAATGAEPVEWNFKTECCGATHSVPRTDIVLKLVNDILHDAKSHGADAVAVACPLCSVNLDMRQKEVEAKYNTKYGLPIPYITQLLGLSLGASSEEVGMGKLLVPAAGLISKIGHKAPEPVGNKVKSKLSEPQEE